MSKLNQFNLPAFQDDFPESPSQYQELVALWTTNLTAWINQGIVGNPWNVTNASKQTFFYNPRYTDIPDNTPAAGISWNAFPNRLKQYLENNAQPPNHYSFTQDQILELADTGYYQTPQTPENSFPLIPVDHSALCPQIDWNSNPDDWQIYGPYGPRGWQDEYCEWSVTRNSDQKITRVDFVCENPEYWYSLWKIDPQKACQIYEDTLNYNLPDEQKISVAIEDLYLLDSQAQPVIDPQTGEPAYNPLNKWNCGPVSIRTGDASNFSGGAIHLTSTPNTLQTELGLAGAATVQRPPENSSSTQALICCSQYGQNYRNSDPNIGAGVNNVVRLKNLACLADPAGLYIQMPSFSSYSIAENVNLPEGANISDCWHIVRGKIALNDPVTGKYFSGQYYGEYEGTQYNGVGNFILHAVFQIPQKWQELNNNSLTLSDILINGQPIEWGGQIAQTFNMSLYARGITTTDTPPILPCVDSPDSRDIANQPLQLMDKVLWDGYYAIQEPNPAQQAIPLASNTTYMITTVQAGQSGIQIALTYAPASEPPNIPIVEFSVVDDANPIANQEVDSKITAKVLGEPTKVHYAVPGNSYPSDSYVLYLELDVASDASEGLRGVRITDTNQTPAPFMPGLLNVVANT